MKKKLEKYRKKHNFSYGKMAEKLNISIEEHKEIENNYEKIDNKQLKKRIMLLLSTTNLDGIASISPALEAMKKANQRIDAMVPDYVKNLNKITSTINPNPFGNLSGFIKKSQEQYNPISNSLAFLSGSITPDYLNQIKHLAEANSKIDKSISSILKPMGIAFTGKNNFVDPSKVMGMSMVEVAMKIRENTSKYDSFLETSKSLSKAVFVNSSLVSAFEKLQYLNLKKSYNKFDYLFGNSFTQYIKDIHFDKDMELIEEIGNNPEFKEKAQFIVKEVEEILSEDNEIVNEDKLDSLLIVFSQWIKKSFGDNYAKSVFKIFLYLLPFIINHYNNKSNTKNQNNNKKEIITKLEALEKKTDRHIKTHEKSYPNMTAKTDVNLRIRQRKKSRKLGVVKKGQIVMVLDVKVKWMKIVYDDFKTNNSMSGWVYIDYFQKRK